MTMTSTNKTMREGPLLVLTVGLVGLVCFPLWQMLDADESVAASAWTSQRWMRLLLGPEQIINYCCFIWAMFILITRFWEIKRQRQAFALDLLPTEEGARILQEDAWPLQRKVEQINTTKGPFILANMIRVALGKFAVSRLSQDVGESLKAQAELDQARMAATMSTVNYLAWAIPAIGFFGTVRGLAGSMTIAGQGGEMVRNATRHLTVAFDCTLVALGLSLLVMFFLHALQRDEEALVIDCQQYCLEHLVNRIYEPEPLEDVTAIQARRQTTPSSPFIPAHSGEGVTR
jgi:biopolymer transport protein ExbB/TolQ